MSEPAGNNIKKNQQHWLPLLPIYFYDLGFTLLPEVEDVCARVCAYTQTDSGTGTCHVSTLERYENTTPGHWSLRQSTPLPCVPGWDA